MRLNFKHFLALNVLDVLLTLYAITFLGMREGNPILYPIFQQIGLLYGLVVIKTLGIICVYTLITKTPPEIKINAVNKNGRELGNFLICSLMVLVVANNVYQIIFSFF